MPGLTIQLLGIPKECDRAIVMPAPGPAVKPDMAAATRNFDPKVIGQSGQCTIGIGGYPRVVVGMQHKCRH